MLQTIIFWLTISLMAGGSPKNTTLTPQDPDLLIIKSDTFYLTSYPLEQAKLKLKEGMIYYPKGGTNCWRGYQATWQVENSKLYLVNMQEGCNSLNNIDMINYFSMFTPNLKFVNNRHFADWYSADLVQSVVEIADPMHIPKYICSIEDKYNVKNKTIQLKFRNGILIK